jgi:hypothetical protein
MFTVTATFDVTLLYFVAANVICILAYVLLLKHKGRSVKRNTDLIAKTIVDYFRENGNDVRVECISRARGRRFVALISSKPSKRFRNSHIVELGLTAHVRKVRGLDLEKVYWCFPVKTKQDLGQVDAASDGVTVSASARADVYFDEEATLQRKLPGYRVKELPLEQFDELVTRQRLTARASAAAPVAA